MPLPLTVSCFSKIQVGFTFLVPAHPGSPGKVLLNGCVCLQSAREQWAEILWANLNVQQLQEGIESYLKALRKLPREVKNLDIGKVLDERMKEFRDSLPLFVDLKHEALRDRCVLHTHTRTRTRTHTHTHTPV